MPGSDRRSPLSVGIDWASRIAAVGFVFAVPPLAGFALDRQFGSGPVGILVGMTAGFAAGIVALLRIVGGPSRPA